MFSYVRNMERRGDKIHEYLTKHPVVEVDREYTWVILGEDEKQG